MLELGDLVTHPLLEALVELTELDGLLLDRVVVALDAEERPDAGQELRLVDRLADEVVGAGHEG